MLSGRTAETGSTFLGANPKSAKTSNKRWCARYALGIKLTAVRTAFTVRAPAHGLDGATVLTLHCFYAEHTGSAHPLNEIAELAWLDPLDPLDAARAAPAVQAVFTELAAIS